MKTRPLIWLFIAAVAAFAALPFVAFGQSVGDVFIDRLGASGIEENAIGTDSPPKVFGINASDELVGFSLGDNLSASGNTINASAGALTVSELTDTTIDSIGASELLQWNGSAWINRTLAEAGIASFVHGHSPSALSSFSTNVLFGMGDSAGSGTEISVLAPLDLSGTNLRLLSTGANDGDVLTADGANGVAWEAPSGGGGGSPAGSGSELQYRVDGSTFGAVTSSSVSGANLTLGGTLTLNSIEIIKRVTLPTPSMGSGWTDNGDGTYTSTNASGFNGITFNSLSLEEGSVYIVKLKVTAHTSGNTTTYLGSSGSGQADGTMITSAYGLNRWGSSIHCYDTGDPSILHIRCNNGFVGTIGEITVTKIHD